ncbi:MULTISPECIES: hypothetical protein [Streptomyces]|jgi:hypothetical protein|uniref:Secreted protein n=1 Tax=Streptomyces thermoviolaceus subsp. thermoviolaceus TaxID=66860 RepID=A0ABX0Z083_STRTL|nr:MULTISPECIES: hypothetical protein [Streptomyces]MCM3266131.1 hypothetical protein [Streptomyces thermoviolaceus]NJP16710.1 hypothetical protein [Streptomyces thermoviolaceus subsp. thermoviolaceus]RSS01300.1 hypothetical protein EF917_15600 [Streptomyces sp. WAC00469]WTD49186.1 hypothetical protein OG899_17695 [Streptomyces thermoviolaceus]GGV80566.1 hypothetical protein GCM10010499_43750 [Streptomyces thermoviolaceus subsp. apingens]
MKTLKAAAVLAGSLVAAGAAAPAFAHAPAAPTSVNGAVTSLTEGPLDVMPVHHQTHALDSEKQGSLLNRVKGTTERINDETAPLLGGLPVQ